MHNFDFEPVLHEDHFDIKGDPHGWIERHHPDAEYHSHDETGVYVWDGGKMTFDGANLNITDGDDVFAVHVGLESEVHFDRFGDMMDHPARAIAITQHNRTVTMMFLDGTVVTDIVDENNTLQRSMMSSDGITQFPPRLKSGWWEVSRTSVMWRDVRVATRLDGRWLWNVDTEGWLRARAEMADEFRGHEFDDEGIPVC